MCSGDTSRISIRHSRASPRSADAIDALTRHLGVAVVIGTPAADGSYSVDHTAAIFLIDPTASQAALFGSPHEAAVIVRDYRRIVAARPR